MSHWIHSFCSVGFMICIFFQGLFEKIELERYGNKCFFKLQCLTGLFCIENTIPRLFHEASFDLISSDIEFRELLNLLGRSNKAL